MIAASVPPDRNRQPQGTASWAVEGGRNPQRSSACLIRVKARKRRSLMRFRMAKSKNKGPMAPVQMKATQMASVKNPEKEQRLLAMMTMQEQMKGKPVNRLK